MIRQVVVGVALLDGAGRVLAAQRSEPPQLAGFWELPGGKVEAGEDELAALVRECEEELGVTVVVGDRIGPDLPIGPSGVLRVWSGQVTGGEPRPLEHTELRWLEASLLDSVEWLPADVPLLPYLRDALLASAPPATP